MWITTVKFEELVVISSSADDLIEVLSSAVLIISNNLFPLFTDPILTKKCERVEMSVYTRVVRGG